MWNKLKSTWGLGIQLAKAGFKLRNEGSYLGIFWYLLNPLLLFGLLFLVFSDRLGAGIPEYALYLLLGVVMFNFFQNSTIESTRTIAKDYSGLIKSINFPRESLVFGVVLKNLFSHFFEIILFAIVLIAIVPAYNLIFYPLILLIFCIFIYGSCLLLTALTVYFVDLENIWNFAVRLLWLGTPIFYAIGGQTRLFYANLLNPLYYFITITRESIIYGRMPALWLILGGLIYSLIFVLAGTIVFNKLKAKFAELI